VTCVGTGRKGSTPDASVHCSKVLVGKTKKVNGGGTHDCINWFGEASLHAFIEVTSSNLRCRVHNKRGHVHHVYLCKRKKISGEETDEETSQEHATKPRNWLVRLLYTGAD